MYYVNSFFLFSLFGFVLESDIYKIAQSKRYSSIFYGPVTTVYGFGVLALILLKKYVFDKWHFNKFLKLFLIYIICTIVLTLIEFIGGNVLNYLFDVNMWDYTKKACNFGKYICLELALVWGLFGLFYIYYFKSFMDKIITLIPKWVSMIWLVIFFIDLVFVFLTK